MKRKLILVPALVVMTFTFFSINKVERVPAKAESESASLLFAHGTPGVDLFYNYCPSILQEEDGTRHVYYCTNKDAGNVTDYIGYRRGILTEGVYSYSDETLVLSPTEDMWDERHVCDPNVIKGSFTYNSHEYSYLMAYLGCVTNDNSHNEVGLAVSDYPAGPWTKVDSLNPFCHFTGTYGYDGWEWGYGQVSMISMDYLGQVLFTFTAGEKSGTHIFAEKWDFTSLDSPIQLTSRKQLFTTGLTKNNKTSDNVLNNADFVYDDLTERIYLIRDNHPSAELNPTVATQAQIAYLPKYNGDPSIGGNLFANSGTWVVLSDLTVAETGLSRNHNACLIRDEYGHMIDSSYLEAVVTSGNENGANDWWTALSTYRLYSYKITINNTSDDYSIDVGSNISFVQTPTDYLATWRLMPQNQNFSNGNAIAIRIRNNTGVDTPFRLMFNCTSNYRYSVVNNGDESKTYGLLSTNGVINTYPYRTWDGDVWLKPNFDGWLIVKKSDFITDTSYPNEGSFTWSSIFGIYFAIQTYYDHYANYDIGDVYSVYFINNETTFINPVFLSGLVSYIDTTNNFVLDSNGEGKINISRNNTSFIKVVKFIDEVIKTDSCSPSSESGYNNYPYLKALYDDFSNDVVLYGYYSRAHLLDYASGDSEHNNGLSALYLVSEKWNAIQNRYTYKPFGAELLFDMISNANTNVTLIIIASIIGVLITSIFVLKKKKQ